MHKFLLTGDCLLGIYKNIDSLRAVADPAAFVIRPSLDCTLPLVSDICRRDGISWAACPPSAPPFPGVFRVHSPNGPMTRSGNGFSSPGSSGAPPGLVHFGGDWPPDEQEQLRTAIRELEATEDLPGPPPLGACWVCSRVEFGDLIMYFASRHGIARTAHGRSAEDLTSALSEAFSST